MNIATHASRAVSDRIAALLGAPGTCPRLLDESPLRKSRVFRQRWQAGQEVHAFIVKRFSSERACVERRALQRWLMAAGMDAVAPRLLAVVTEERAEAVWHVYDDLGDATLDAEARGARDAVGDAAKAPADRGFLSPVCSRIDDRRLGEVLRLAASLHDAFIAHPLLGDCRYWGGDLGANFLEASVRDAITALVSPRLPRAALSAWQAQVRDGLLEWLLLLEREQGWRCEQLRYIGGPETLLHGDLSVRNALVCGGGERYAARLIDWDHAGVGPASYDLSNLLAQLPVAQRESALRCYLGLRERGFASWPSRDEWNALFDTAERARLANSVIWPALAVLDGELDDGFDELAAISHWFAALSPVLPGAAEPAPEMDLPVPAGESDPIRSWSPCHEG